uniref:t-SNARE coiled-coil homology domain-containing protein n=1 Tax=Haemonchus placei TaxID=6290 RepID=A0A0N4WYE2_HAEPC
LPTSNNFLNRANEYLIYLQGATNIQQAVYYNQKARQKKMLLFAFVVILFLIIGLTIYLAR